MKRFILLLVILFLIIMQGRLFADLIYLKSGAKIEGIIEKETDKAVTISIKIGGVTYPKTQIESIFKASDEENAKIKEKWKAQKELKETEREQWKKFATEQEAKGLIYHNGKWITKDEHEKLTKPKVEEEVVLKEKTIPETQKEEFKEERPPKPVDIISFYDRFRYKYAVRLPPQYNTKTKWPVLFMFDPGANGGEAAYRFAYAVDKLGWIVVGSLDAKNGPWGPIRKAEEAMLKDIPKRFSVDEKRYYAGGLSGGARMAFLIAYNHPTQFKGVIPCAAGFPAGTEYEISKNVAVYLCVGEKDSNLEEVKGVYRKLHTAGAEVYLDEFEGGHEWPPEEVIINALDWIAEKTK